MATDVYRDELFAMANYLWENAQQYRHDPCLDAWLPGILPPYTRGTPTCAAPTVVARRRRTRMRYRI